MLFELSQENSSGAIQTSVIPEEYAGIVFPDHTAHVTIADSCTLIHQTIDEKGFSLWINNFFIHQEEVLLCILPKTQMYSLYYSIENIAELLIGNEPMIIPPQEFCWLDLAPGQHYGVFEKGIYTSLHLTVDQHNKSIMQDLEYAAAFLREYYFDTAFQPH